MLFGCFVTRAEDQSGAMMRIILLLSGILFLAGCATSTSQTAFVDAGGHACTKAFKKVAPFGIAISESVECSEIATFAPAESSKPSSPRKAKQKKHWFWPF